MKKTEKKESARSRIITAAWQLFYEKGYNNTTVDEIIDLSGTSKGSFYYYFGTKDELLDTLAGVLDDYYETLEQQMDPEMDSFDKLLFLNYEVHKMMEKKINRDLITSLYSTQLVAAGQRQLLNQNRKYYHLISGIVEEGQKRGQIKTDAPISQIVRYYAMCERALVSDWCLKQGEFSLAEYSRTYMPIMMEHFKGLQNS